jgi:hypothetical protein
VDAALLVGASGAGAVVYSQRDGEYKVAEAAIEQSEHP